MITGDPNQKQDDESPTLSSIFAGVSDMLSVFKLLSCAVFGLFRAIAFALGGLSRLLP